jgi:hypothetical protein
VFWKGSGARVGNIQGVSKKIPFGRLLSVSKKTPLYLAWVSSSLMQLALSRQARKRPKKDTPLYRGVRGKKRLKCLARYKNVRIFHPGLENDCFSLFPMTWCSFLCNVCGAAYIDAFRI